MKKIFKKTLSLVLCVAFSGMQMSLAALPTTLTGGDWAGKDVLSGTGAKISGHTSGLSNVTTDLKNATLEFTKNTRIDWTKLNVDKGQTLNFKNGNFGVLNNVLGTSISKFAGKITAENGKIVISNPNGMLFSNGSFTGTSIVLTTKDLKAMGATDAEIAALFDGSLNEKIQAVQNGDDFGLIVIGGSTITAPDINIISNGAYIQASTLESPDQGGVVLVSADGANFVAKAYNVGGANINMSSVGPLTASNSVIKTQGGEIQFVSNGRIDAAKVKVDGNLTMDGDRLNLYSGSQVTGNVVMKDKVDSHTESGAYTNGVWVMDTTIDGNLTATTPDNVNIRESKVTGSVDVKTDSQAALRNIEFGDTAIESGLYTRLYSTTENGNKIHGDLKINKANSLSIGNVDSTSHEVQYGTLTVDGDLVGNIDSTICISDAVTANNITLISDKSSILTAYRTEGENAGKNGTLTAANDIKLQADKGEITSVNADVNIMAPKLIDYDNRIPATDENGNVVIVPSSQYYELMSTQDHITMQDLIGLNKTGVEITGQSAEVSAMGAVAINADLEKDLDVKSGRDTILTGSVDGNVKSEAIPTVVNGVEYAPQTVQLDGLQVGGNAELKAGRINIINGTDVKGNVVANDVYDNHTATGGYTSGVWMLDSNVDGNLTVTTPDNVNIRESKVGGAVDIKSDSQVALRNIEFGKTDIESGLYTRISGTQGNKIHGDLNINKANSLSLGNVDSTTREVQYGSLTVDGDLNANIYSTICVSDAVKANNINMTSQNSSILTSFRTQGENAGKDGILEAYNIALNAPKGEITSINADVNITAPLMQDYVNGIVATDANGNTIMVNSSQYFEMMAHQDHVTMQNLIGLNKAGVEVKGGSAQAKAMGAVAIQADLAGNLDVETGRDTIIKGSVDGNVKATAKSTVVNGVEYAPQTVQLDGLAVGKDVDVEGGRINIINGTDVKGNVKATDTFNNHTDNENGYANGIWLMDSNIDGNFTAETPDNINVRESSVGGASKLAATDGRVNLRNVQMDGDVEARANRLAMVYGNSTFGGDLDISGNSIHFGSINSSNGAITPGSVTIAGNLKATAPSTIGYSVDVVANKMEFDSANSSFVQANTDTYKASLTADEITIKTASGGVAVALDANTANALDANGNPAVDTYYYAMTRDYVVGAKSADEFEALNVRTRNGDTMTLNLGSGITNIDSNAANTIAGGVEGKTINDLKLQGNGEMTVSGLTAVKVANDADNKTGSVVVATSKPNADIKIGNVTTDTDIIALNPNGTVTQTGALTADKEGNNVGDVILGAKRLNDIGGNNAIKGANVDLSQTEVPAENTIRLSNITASAVGTDNAGDITITMPAEHVDLSNIHATHDITVLNDPNVARDQVVFDTVKLSDVIADSEENGRGDLNLKARNNIVAENIGGANINLTSIDGDVTVNGAKSARHADDTTTAAQASNGAAGPKSGNIVITAENGNITIGGLTAATDVIGMAENGNVNVVGNLTADAQNLATAQGLDNGIGDVILSGKKLVGDNFTTPDSQIAIKGAGVEITQSTPQDNLVLSNITADATGNDNSGDVTINVPVKSVDLNDIYATKDITVNNGTADGVLDSAILKNVIADSEENGIGDLNIKTKGDITAQNIGGANITLESTDGNIAVDGARSARGNQPDADAGNISIIAKSDDAVISLGGISADTDVLADASNGSINQTGNIIADAIDKNGVGTVTLKAKDGLDVGGDKGTIMGGDIVLEVSTGDIIASDLIADGQGDDNHGNISIYTPNGDVTIGTPDKAVTGTGDVTIVTDNGKANVVNTEADSEKNGIGTLTIKATEDVTASNVGGGNVVIETDGDITAEDVTAHAPNDENNGDIIITSGSGDVTLDGANADHDIVITPGKDADGNYIGDAKVNDAHADADNDKKGDLIINGKNVIVDADVVVDQDGNEVIVPTGDNSTGNNVHIDADNDVIADNVEAKDDIIINAGNDVIADNLIADNEPDGIGDLIINAGNDVTIDGGDGSNVTIDAGGDVVAEDITAHGSDDAPNDDGNITITAGGDVTTNDTHSVQDTEITAGGDVNVTDAEADSDNDGKGDLIIHGKGDVNVDGGEGANVEVTSDNGDVNVKDITADGDDDNGDGNVKIDAPNGDVTAEDVEANKDIIITVDGGKVTLKEPITPDLDGNDIGELIINGVRPGGLVIDGTISSEVTKILNSLYQSGVDTTIAQSFTPIAFAAGDDEDESYLAKRIAKTVFKTPETGIVTITEQYKSMR